MKVQKYYIECDQIFEAVLCEECFEDYRKVAYPPNREVRVEKVEPTDKQCMVCKTK